MAQAFGIIGNELCWIKFYSREFAESCEVYMIKHVIKFYYQFQPFSMLKFKEIKRAIINPHGDISPSPIVKRAQITHQASFKSFLQAQELSPHGKHNLNDAFNSRFDTDKKGRQPMLSEFNIKSDSKENNPKCLYYNRSPTSLYTEKLDFGQSKKRKIGKQQPSQYYETSHQSSVSKNNNLSFANLLQSKRNDGGSKSKKCLDSDRKNDRQSSISKLKDKLFGMKKLISNQQKPKNIEFNRCQTDRFMNRGAAQQKNIFKGCHIDPYDLDSVKISLKNEEPSVQELNMAPYF